MLNAAILAVVVATGALLLYPRVAMNRMWRANMTPLASIIGSGFLVLGPILEVSFGWAAPLVMLSLVVLAYLFGSAIRYNIRYIAASPNRPQSVERLEAVSSAVLAFAYIISVAYYLNLFGAFSVSLTAVDDAYHARLVTSAVFATILLVGWFYGFAALERMEQFSVGLKLAIIAGLLFALTVYFGDKARQDALLVNPASVTGWTAVPLIFGLIVTVQGFETSRYLGATYDPATRINSMRFAQVLSSIIYIVYVALLAYVFVPSTMVLDETSIIDLMKIVAPMIQKIERACANGNGMRKTHELARPSLKDERRKTDAVHWSQMLCAKDVLRRITCQNCLKLIQNKFLYAFKVIRGRLRAVVAGLAPGPLAPIDRQYDLRWPGRCSSGCTQRSANADTSDDDQA